MRPDRPRDRPVAEAVSRSFGPSPKATDGLRLYGRRFAIWNMAALPAGRDWYHRLPCCGKCSVCGGQGCFVWAPDEDPGELHICWRGCDGLPPRLLAQAGAA